MGLQGSCPPKSLLFLSAMENRRRVRFFGDSSREKRPHCGLAGDGYVRNRKSQPGLEREMGKGLTLLDLVRSLMMDTSEIPTMGFGNF